MNSKLILSSIFILLALFITTGVFWSSKQARVDESQAAGFGISPPYVHFLEMAPGEEALTSIRIIRGDDTIEQKVTARFDKLEIADWITILPGPTMTMMPGERSKSFQFKISIPEKAASKNYSGDLYFAISSASPVSGVGIALGARAEVKIAVSGAEPESLPADPSLASDTVYARGDLAERLEGAFIMRPAARGELYYIAPRTKILYPINSIDSLLALARKSGRGIANELLAKLPLEFRYLYGPDQDGEGLPDAWEQALGTDPAKRDSDADGFDDLYELSSGFSPLGQGQSLAFDQGLAANLAGEILLQSEGRGEIWYISLRDAKRVLLSAGSEALQTAARTAIGLSEENYLKLVK